MSDIETRLFRYFVAVAEELHFARASLRLGISGPTLSQQIKKLEDQLGVRLLGRKGNTRVELTEAGLRFLERAQQVLRQVEEAKLVAQQAARGELGSIDIGFMPAATWSGILQKLVGEFRRANPAIEITMHRLTPMAQIAGILQNNLDVGFTRSPDKYPAALDGFDIYRQPMVLALPQKHRLARLKKIDPAILKDEIFVNTGPELDVGFWGHSEAVAGIGKFTPRVAKRDHDLVTVMTYVALGYGVAAVPRSMCNVTVPTVVYREFAANPPLVTSIAYVHRRNEMSPSAKLLTKYMARHALPR